ncbi:outer membrane protein assembly factor BamE [Komagataeibacter sp. AV436]|uniref:Outer membrane protein assembly factor BamE n=2 Tax=Komagataeibacter melomenusus TaxID=2766578 RepID=A0ABX2A9J8_9PROT|nr:outer membrane protein assembly factor BamE [Komagataeibacter melomenusus]MBV1829700.1 outer membrane protein assembly factor BamE [Komagataeibacter melomenusus]NPC65099.1 outer membrane protein assembly factor BamE [Komagataeibacter melomenusus]
MNKVSLAACLAAALLVAGCQSSGNTSIRKETAETVDQKIQDNVTTKQQVRTMFGDPMNVHFTDSGHEEWQYSYEYSRQNGTNFVPYYGSFSNGTHGREKNLTIIFNNDVVWHHSLTSSKVQAHDGL